MEITKRDLRILESLKRLGFMSFHQIKDLFFKGKVSACENRLSILLKKGFIESISLKKALKDSKGFHFQPTGFSSRKKLYSLPNKKRQFKGQSSLIHQMLLSESLTDLKKLLPQSLFLDQKDIAHNIDKGLRPDAILVGEDFKLAIELERWTKNRKAYFKKINLYSASTYTHVLYCVTTEKAKKALLKRFTGQKKIGVCFFNHCDLVFSPLYGALHLNQWMDKLNKKGGYDE